jgi:hypothetical protein
MSRHSPHEQETWDKYHTRETAKQQIGFFDPNAWNSPGQFLHAAFDTVERKYTEYRVKRDRVHTDVYESMMEWPWIRVFTAIILGYLLFIIIRRGWNYMRQ